MKIRRIIFVFLLCLAMVFSLGGTVLAQDDNPQQENTETETFDEIENENEIISNNEIEEASQTLEEGELKTEPLTHLPDAKGKLTVRKVLAGNVTNKDKDKEFEFTVTLDETGSAIAGSAVALQSGGSTSINIKLKGGQSKTIEVKDGTKYKVEEKDYSEDGFETTCVGNEGTIDKDKPAIAEFTNTKTAKSRLTIKNILAGKNADKNKLFEFSIFLTDDTINENFSGVQFHQGGATIILKGDQSKIIEGLPDKVGYRIVQTDYSADGYATTSFGTEGIIDNDTPAVAEFTNTIYASDDSADYDDSGDKEKGKATDDEPETGDDSNMGLWLGSMALSLIGLTGVIIARRRKNSL